MKWIALLISHGAIGALGFALGIYALPILIASETPATSQLTQHADQASYQASFKRELPGSDWLHWGEGKLAVGPKQISFIGELAPGPDYKLYLSPEFVEDEAQVLAIKDDMLRVADISSFKGFMAKLPEGTDLERYNTVLVWCETFGEFISAAQYR